MISETRVKELREGADEGVNSFNASLNENRNRAQAAASWAMSIVHITLLKAIIDRGSNLQYFYPSLVMVSIAIAIQITVGVLALIVGNLNMYYSKFDDVAFMQNSKKCVFCGGEFRCCSEWQSNASVINADDIAIGQSEVSVGKGLFSVIRKIEGRKNKRTLKRLHRAGLIDTEDGDISYIDRLSDDEVYESLYRPGGCMTRLCLRRTSPTLEERVEEWYTIWKVMYERFEYVLQEKKTRLAEKRRVVGWDVIDVANFARLEVEILKQDATKAAMAKQGEHLDGIRDTYARERVFKMTSRYQRIINYLLYIVFIMNALIAALGLATTN